MRTGITSLEGSILHYSSLQSTQVSEGVAQGKRSQRQTYHLGKLSCKVSQIDDIVQTYSAVKSMWSTVHQETQKEPMVPSLPKVKVDHLQLRRSTFISRRSTPTYPQLKHQSARQTINRTLTHQQPLLRQQSFRHQQPQKPFKLSLNLPASTRQSYSQTKTQRKIQL